MGRFRMAVSKPSNVEAGKDVNSLSRNGFDAHLQSVSFGPVRYESLLYLRQHATHGRSDAASPPPLTIRGTDRACLMGGRGYLHV